jgi:hypothetical protein
VKTPEWRWLLVDALAHGRKWYNPLHASLVDDPKYKLLSEQYDEEADLRVKMEIAKLMMHSLNNNMNSFYCEFTRPEAAKILSTPRFDINDAFMKADIPSSQEEYFAKLPSLAVPFPEFWIEWKWIDEKHTAHFCCRITSSDPLEDGSLRLSMTSFIWMPSCEKDNNTCLRHQATAFLSPSRKIERLVFEGQTKKPEATLLFPCIHAMALLGCKNVTTHEVHAPRPMRRNVERTFGVALCSYRVVTIVPGKRTLVSQSNVKGAPRAMSICRGHFKTFDDHGLFGYKKGTWWWQGHVRGEYERGVIVKDYAIARKSA